MKTQAEPITQIDAEHVEDLDDWQLEEELTIAALTSYRNRRFELLLAERRRRAAEAA